MDNEFNEDSTAALTERFRELSMMFGNVQDELSVIKERSDKLQGNLKDLLARVAQSSSTGNLQNVVDHAHLNPADIDLMNRLKNMDLCRDPAKKN